MTEGAVGNERGRRRADEGMYPVPDAVYVRDLVGDELDDEESDRDAQNKRVGEHLEGIGELDDAESLEQTGGRDRGIDVESGGERGAEGEAQRFEGRHGRKLGKKCDGRSER